MPEQVTAFAAGHPVVAVVSAVALLVLAVVTCRAAVRRARVFLSGHQAEDVLTVFAALVATLVAMNGMWRFFGDVLHFTGADRVAVFAFLELAVVTEAFRARRNIRESAAAANAAVGEWRTPDPVTAGADGIAVWAISILSGIFASLDATSAGAALFRLAAPLVAAWLWERGLSLYRRRLTGRRTIHWRFTLERVAIWAGLADTSGRTTGEADTARRLTRLARSAKRARTAGWGRRWWAVRRLDTHLSHAVTYTGLATEAADQRRLKAQLGALLGAQALIAWTPLPPWRDATDGRQDRHQNGASGSGITGRQDRRQDGASGQGGGGRQDRRQPSRQDAEAGRQRVREILTRDWNTPIADVAAEAGVSESTVDRVRREMPTPLHAATGGAK